VRYTSVGVRVVAFGGLALAGLVGGHAFGYAVAVPDAQHRAALIADTGHAYLPSLSWAAVVCGLAALIAGVAAGYLHRGPARSEWRSTMSVVVAMQAGAFVLIELIERIAAGASLGTLSASLLVIGVAVQALVGLIVAALLIGLRRAGAMVRSALVFATAPPAGHPMPRSRLLVRRTWHQASNRVRAPPSSAAA
jgi:hypothetical protein